MRIKLPKIVHKPSLKMEGQSFLFWIWIKDKKRLDDKILINHEMIHYRQQVELVFVFGWLVYGLLHLYTYYRILRGIELKYKRNTKWKTAYRNHPMEVEAYDNDDNLDYLKQRKFLAWIKYFK